MLYRHEMREQTSDRHRNSGSPSWFAPSDWHSWYLAASGLFTMFHAGYVREEEFYNPENEGIYSTFLAMRHNAGPFVILSAGLAVIKVEVTGMTGDRLMEAGQCAEGIEGIHRCIAGRFRHPERAGGRWTIYGDC